MSDMHLIQDDSMRSKTVCMKLQDFHTQVSERLKLTNRKLLERDVSI